MYTIFDTVATYPPCMAEGRVEEISLQDPEDVVNTSVVSRKVQTGSQFPTPPTTRRTYTAKITFVVNKFGFVKDGILPCFHQIHNFHIHAPVFLASVRARLISSQSGYIWTLCF